ncbi:MAG TPA: hypothetical protein VEH80_04955 [Candidatus Bathyarchaeia archaeon]|nr:hypothetical protein [Candidatus Bathyarchaeia archaeon]
MADELLYGRPTGLLALGFLVLLLIAAELGFVVGRRYRSRSDEPTMSQITTVQAGVLGLLGLLLGFTFTMAVSRYDARKHLVVEEATSISTAVLRGQLLPAPQAEDVAGLFREYVDARLQATERERRDQEPGALRARTIRIQSQLWAQATAAAEKDPRAVTVGLFAQALNEMFDNRARWQAALDDHVPESVLFLLAVVALFAVGITGFGFGLRGHRAMLAQLSLWLLITLVVLVIVDLDRPRRGLIRVSQTSLLNLQESLSRNP